MCVQKCVIVRMFVCVRVLFLKAHPFPSILPFAGWDDALAHLRIFVP